MIGRAQFLHSAGYSVLLIDLRGTGETVGRHITMGWDERHDVEAAVDFIRAKNAPGKIGIVGTSLGGAAALLSMPPVRVDALVLEAVYPTIARATRNRLRPRLGSLEPITTSLLLSQIHFRLGITASALSPLDHIASANCPVFIIGGTKDRNTTIEDTRMLFAAARAPKKLWLIDGAAHVDFHRFAREEYEGRVIVFLTDSFGGKR
ncbi:MAG: alpha/beta fold hydrolase [Verrucomicrobiota bacterium]|nr:alpha/beta fold hydrolase [Verrucomicrobiota bacterium]